MATSRGARQPAPMTPFQALVRERRKTLGMSTDDVARAAGRVFTRQTVSNWESRPLVRAPATARLRGLARALRLPYAVVQDAMAESLGLRTARDPGSDLRLWMDEAEERLTENQQRALALMIAPMIDLLESQEDHP